MKLVSEDPVTYEVCGANYEPLTMNINGYDCKYFIINGERSFIRYKIADEATIREKEAETPTSEELTSNIVCENP